MKKRERYNEAKMHAVTKATMIVKVVKGKLTTDLLIAVLHSFEKQQTIGQ